jgi:hypothetical protein
VAWLDLRLFLLQAIVLPVSWALVRDRRPLETAARQRRERSADIGSYLGRCR